MRISKILILLIFGFGLLPSIPMIENVVPIAEAKSYRTVYGYGATEAQAYADARSKIPSGYTEDKARISPAGSRFKCILRCVKP